MHNKTKYKLILKPVTNELSETKSRCKKTRKMKGGWSLFKSTPKTPVGGPIVPSQQVQQPVTNVASAAIQMSAGVALINTLTTLVSNALARPEVLATVTGIAGSSLAAASGGVIVIVAVVIMSAMFVVREKKKAYNGLILVMDELFLVLQKLSGIADISMHIAETYGFPIDTRDVNIALNAILIKFDELLDPTTDYAPIQKDLANFRESKEKFAGKVNLIIDEVNTLEQSQDTLSSEPQKITLWASVKSKSNSAVKGMINFKKQVIDFSASKFVEELNEAVAYLALYVAALSASFSTTYTTVVVQLLVNGNQMTELKALQDKVLNDIKFHSMLEGALVYPLLQSQKTHATCLNRKPPSSCDPTFVNAANDVLSYMQDKFKQSNVQGSIGSALYTKMPNLNQLVTAQPIIKNAIDANDFANKVKAAFDTDKGGIIPGLIKPQPPPPPAGPPAASAGGEFEMMEIAPATTAPVVAPVVAPATTVPDTAAPATAAPVVVAPNAVAQIQKPSNTEGAPVTTGQAQAPA